MKKLIILPFLLLLTGCFSKKATTPYEPVEVYVKQFYPFFYENNISKLSCHGEYLDFLNEFDITSKKAYNDKDEEIYASEELLGNGELFIVEKHKEHLSVKISDQVAENTAIARASLNGCIRSYIYTYNLQSKNRVLENPLLRRLYAAEKTNSADLTEQEYKELKLRRANDKEIDRSFAEKINEVINLDSAAALDIRDSHKNLQRIVDNLDLLESRELTKYTIVELGIEFNEKEFQDFGVTVATINNYLKAAPDVDTSTELGAFLQKISKLSKGSRDNLYILTADDYSALGIEVDELYLEGINEGLKNTPQSDITKRDPKFINTILSSLKRIQSGNFIESDIELLGLDYSLDTNQQSSFDAINTIISLRKDVYAPGHLQQIINAISKLNQVVSTNEEELSIVTYSTLGIDMSITNKTELDSFLEENSKLINNPKALYEYSLLLNRMYLGELIEEDLETLNLTNVSDNLSSLNYVLAKRSNENLSTTDLPKIVQAIEKLSKTHSKRVTLSENDFKTLGLFEKKNRHLIRFFNKEIDYSNNLTDVVALDKFMNAFIKLQLGEKENSADLNSEEFAILGLTEIDSATSTAINEVINSDEKQVIQIGKDLTNLKEIYLLFQKLKSSQTAFKSYSKLGIKGSNKLSFNELNYLIHLDKNSSIQTPNRYSELIVLSEKFNELKSKSILDFSYSDYKKLGVVFQKNSEEKSKSINQFFNEFSNFTIEKIPNINVFINDLYNKKLTTSSVAFFQNQRKYLQRDLNNINKYLEKKEVDFNSFYSLLLSYNKIANVNKNRDSWLVKNSDLRLVNLSSYKTVDKEITLKFINEYIFKFKENLQKRDIELIVEFIDQKKCEKEHLDFFNLPINKLEKANFCRSFISKDLSNESWESLQNYAQALENVANANVSNVDLLSLNYSATNDQNFINYLLSDVNKRLQKINTQELRLELIKKVAANEDIDGYILLPLTNSSLSKYKIEINDLTANNRDFINFVSETIKNFGKPIKKERLKTVINSSANLFNVFNGIGSIKLEDLEKIEMRNSNGTNILQEQVPIISEHLRASDRFLLNSLKVGINNSYNFVY